MSTTRRYHKVEPTILNQGWANEPLLLAFYLLTCEHRSTEGIYKLPMSYAAADLGWSLKKVNKSLAVLVDDGFVEYDPEASVVLLVNALKRQAMNPNQAIAAMKKLKTLPGTYLRRRFYGLAEAFAKPLAKAMADTSPEGFGFGLEEWLGHQQEQEQEQLLKGKSRSSVVGKLSSETSHLREVS